MRCRSLLASVAMSLAACHQRTGPATNAASASAPIAPVLVSMTPSAGDVSRGEIVEVLLTGRGFDSLNIVHFGALRLRQVPRRSASELRFTVPLDDAQRPNRGEAPPRGLASGPYDVRVQTAGGTSNALVFTMTSGRGHHD